MKLFLCKRTKILIIDTDVLINILDRVDKTTTLRVLNHIALEYEVILFPERVIQEFLSPNPRKKDRTLKKVYQSYGSAKYFPCPIKTSKEDLQRLSNMSVNCLLHDGEADAIIQASKCVHHETPSEVHVLTGDGCAIEFLERNYHRFQVIPVPYAEWKKRLLEMGITLP